MPRLSKPTSRAPVEHFWPSTFRDWVEIVGAAGLVGSAIFSAYQYYNSRADRHVEQTLKLLERFESDRFEAAQRTIDQLAINAGQGAQRAVAESATTDTSVAERESMRDRVFVEAVMASNSAKNGDVPGPVIEITSFFNGLEVCIEQDLCDGKVAHASLDAYAASFWKTYRPVILYARGTQRPQFAADMERFVQKTIEMKR